MATITGTVVDSSGTAQANVAVAVLDPSTSSTVTSTTTDAQGDFTVTVAPGTYNLRFTPPSGSGLQSYLATGVSTDSPPLTVILKPIAVVHINGTFSDSKGNVYTNQQNAQLTFSSPLNPGSYVTADASGHYSVDLLADQNVAVSTFVEPQVGPFMAFSLPVGTLDHDQTYNVTMPVSQLSVSVRDSNGNPITGGQFQFDYSSENSLPGAPGGSAYAYTATPPRLDANGNLSLLVPNGITLKNPVIRLDTGLVIPFTAPAVNGDQSVIVTAPPFVRVQGTFSDSKGNVYTNQQNAQLTFSSPLNPGSYVTADASGHYSVDLLADQNVAVSTFVEPQVGPFMAFSLPVGTLDHDQTYNVTMPVSQLSVSVRDSNGNPITGGQFQFDYSSENSLPGAPGGSAYAYTATPPRLDANGNLSLLVPNGITLKNPVIRLDNGLVLSFSLHPITGDRHAFIIFNQTTGTITVDDQPPAVIGAPDRIANANGWYNAPVTITWTSSDPLPSSGTPTTPDPTTVGSEGKDQVVTSGKSCDPASNCATGGYQLSIDETPPTISAAVLGTLSPFGWYGSDPTIHYTCSDALSGVDTCPSDQPVTTDGANQPFVGKATDKAGNTASATTIVSVDTVLPVVSNVAVNPAVVAAGGTTALSADVSDSLSGVEAAEYFVGADPGQGNGTAMTVVNGSATATLSGLPPSVHTVSVRAQDRAGNWSGPGSVQVTVKLAAPTGLSAASPAAVPALTWNPVPGATSYNIYRDGTLIGTATSPSYSDTTAQPGPHSYQVTAVAGSVEGAPSNPVQVVVGIVPAITSPASASTGMRVPFSFTITTSGVPAPSLSESGSLPAGITFTDNGDGTATLAGIAAAGTAGSYPVTITASNGIGSPASQPFTLKVTTAASAPAITSDPSDIETTGVPFSFIVTTTGYPAPKLTKTGSLPQGVSFTDNGDGTATITGTPATSAVGTYTVTITAKSTAGTATQTFTLTITKAPVIKKIANATARTGMPFTKTITAVGSPTPALTESGALPAGITFTDNHDGTATLAGTPAANAGGSYPITITATNALGATSRSFTLIVDQPPAITSPATAAGTVGKPFSFQITTTGYPAPTLGKLGTLPKGLTFKASTGTITGTPAAGTAGTYQIAITAKNSTGTTTQILTITVS